jgi:broad specificity phosphatase PhoE
VKLGTVHPLGNGGFRDWLLASLSCVTVKAATTALKMIQGRCDESVLTEKGLPMPTKLVLLSVASSLMLSTVLPYNGRRRQQRLSYPICLGLRSYWHLANLMEIDLPLWEKQRKTEVQEKFADDYRCWKERPHELCMVIPTTEGTREHFPVLALYEQAQQFWQEILPRHQGGTVLIVAHNGINRCLITSALGIPPAHYHSIQQSNCGINVLNFAGDWGELCN